MAELTFADPMSAAVFPRFPGRTGLYPARQDSGQVPWAQAREKGPGEARGCILIVEDDLAVALTLAEVLRFEDYRVEIATNGANALKCLATMRMAPDLILLDMRMPIMNGWEFARALEDQGTNVPIVVMTAAQDAKGWAEEIRARGYLAKPFDIDELLEVVEHSTR